ncbi:MAG: chemotaxis protein CheR, partial [Gammaproteobacteria bacterium]|nr:chemotaxis protein CheR [Gammaproteobacteria bacterium]
MTTKKPKKSLKPTSTVSGNKEHGKSPANFYIVGIGASAGGYEACAQLLSNLPDNTGMAFVIVQHLHPDHPSALSDLLGRTTTMPVTEITDEMLVVPNHVYVIPPKTALEIFHGRLQLTGRSAEHPHLPIDRFFRSLAVDLESKAIGVILSGTASDGVVGLQAIKAAGGITLSQDEKSAKYDGMPHSAIAAGCVDFILPPNKIAQELVDIARHPYLQLGKIEDHKADQLKLLESKEDINKLFLLLRNTTGIDFTYYKMPTLQRRINRRMILLKIESIKDYVSYLQTHHEEVNALYQDILINVTEFFRDKEAFETLKKDIFPRFISREENQSAIRIWIPGCSTGEEAYSMAMALLEVLDPDQSIGVQIFATDIDDLAIEKARQGIYRESIAENVSEQRLQRFFNKIDGGYQIKKNIRDLCIFAKQNVFKDPPFSKIDLISCRNLLIYLGPTLQKRIFSVFHYALVPNGILFLGSAESLGEQAHLFKIVDQKHKFYSKKSIATPLHLDFSPPSVLTGEETKIDIQSKKYETWSNIDLQQKTDRLIMQKYVPAAVLINDQMQILQFRGHTGRYLEPASGEASLNIMKMVREGLLLHLRGLLQKAMEGHIFIRKDNLQYNYEGKIETTNIEITPIQHPTQSEFCYLVVFEEATPTPVKEKTRVDIKVPTDMSGDKEVLALSQELAATKEYLQSVIEQQEVSNEELRSANEEIQSSNEELQSINEELETAKEELQST